MKLNIIKHIIKHKVLLSRSIKAIGGNLLKLFLINKLAFLLPERFRKIFKILCMFGAKFTLISTVFGVIYSILSGIFEWTFNYKTIIDLILGLILSFETGLFSELRVIFDYYYAKIFDWWISKVETTDKTKAKSLREKIFKNDPVSISPLDPKEKARMNKEYLDNLKKQVNKDNEPWHQRMEREIRELYSKNRTNLNVNITPNYHSLNSWISFDTLKWLMYALIGAGIIYSYYSFFTTVNTYLFDSFLAVYNSLKDFVQNPLTYLSGAGGYLWVNGKELLKRYLLRRFWPFTMWFGQNSLSRTEREDLSNNNNQGEDNYPSETMNELIGPDAPTMEETNDQTPIKPDYNNYKTKEDYERMANEQFEVSQRWLESREEYEERRTRIESGQATPRDLESESETRSEAKDRLFQSPSPEPINEPVSIESINEPGPTQPINEVVNWEQENRELNTELLEKLSKQSEADYMDSLKEHLLEFIEANKDSNDPRVRAFISWAKGQASYDDLKILINKLPKNFSDKWLQDQYYKIFYEFLEVESFQEAKERLGKVLSKK
jgi:hypothetical protein